MYVYVSDVTAADSPLFVLPGSHRLGVTVFPHQIEPGARPDEWRYSAARGRALTTRHRSLVGPVGSVYAWHACLLHGTQPSTSSRARLSLRFVFEKASHVGGEIDALNATIDGALVSSSPEAYRDERGVVVVRKNILNSVR